MDYRRKFTAKVVSEMQQNGGRQTSPYTDFFNGSDYLTAVHEQNPADEATPKINKDDICLIFSCDGAQLYRNKVSECWIYIWIAMDLPPELRYKKKHVLPAGFIPGPGKPKNLDSFLFPSLYHLAALQKEGLKIWDAHRNVIIKSYPFLLSATADVIGMASISGFVGHQGKVHCWIHCPMTGHHKPGTSAYYPALLKPDDYDVEGSSHPDINFKGLL